MAHNYLQLYNIVLNVDELSILNTNLAMAIEQLCVTSFVLKQVYFQVVNLYGNGRNKCFTSLVTALKNIVIGWLYIY